MIKAKRNDSVEKLGISNRLKNCLLRTGIMTVEELLAYPKEEWINLRNLGAKTLGEVLCLVDEIEIYDGPDESEEDEATGYRDILIEDLGLSVRAYHCLFESGIKTLAELVVMTEQELIEIDNMGQKSVKEILSAIEKAEKEAYYRIMTDSAEGTDAEVLKLVRECARVYNISLFKLESIFEHIYNERPEAGKENWVYLAYEDVYLRKALRSLIVNVLKRNGEETELTEIISKMPEHLYNTTVCDEVLLELENEGKVKYNNGMYGIIYPSLEDFVSRIKNERSRELIQERLLGKTLEEIGEAYSLTRERIRQLCARELERRPQLAEDRFLYLYDSYLLSCEEFVLLTDEPERTYYYLDMISSVKRTYKKMPDEILRDEKLSDEVRRRAEYYIVYKDYVRIDGSWVKKNKADIFRYVVMKNCKEKTDYDLVVEYYNELINALGLSDDEKLKIYERSYEHKLHGSNYVLWNFKRALRYYNIDERDYTKLVKELNLSEFNNVELSTLKFFKEHTELMEEYDIRDEYELHGLLKKIWDKYGDCEVAFSKMPTISMGEFDRDMQVLDTLIKYAPISNFELAKRYEETYGFNANTVVASFFGCIDEYFHNGMYSITSEGFDAKQSEIMSRALTDDFYSVEDFTRIMQRELPDAKLELVNSYNIKSLGFMMNAGYIIRKTHASASEFFRMKLTQKDVVDAREFPRAMLSSSAFTSEKYELMNQRVIVEFLPSQYISIRRLNEVGVGIEELEKYCEEVKRFVSKNTFFTVQSIKQDGFYNELDELYFDDWFYSSVLVEDKENIASLRAGGTRIMRLGKEKFNLTDFLYWLVEKENKIDIYDFEKLCENRYGVTIDRSKILELVRNTNMYYDEIMEAVYIDYDTYFEEV